MQAMSTASPVFAKIAQANFIATIGAVLPNARIDFQSGFAMPDFTDSQTRASLGSNDTVTSACSTPRTSDSGWETTTPAADRARGDEDIMSWFPTQKDQWETRTPSSGTPEWTPRCTYAELEPQGVAALTDAVQEFVPLQAPPPAPQTWLEPQQAPLEQAAQRAQTCGGDVEAHSWYRVAYLGGIELRMQPSFLAGRGALLPQNEVFPVSAEIVGADGRIYLRLADGRGWAFDDSALLPHDPSVVRGHFASASHEASQGPVFPLEVAAPSGFPIEATAPPYSYAGPGVPFEQAVLFNASVVDDMPSASTPSWAIESNTLHETQPWGHVALDCLPTWSAPVTSDCPPMWEPSVGQPEAHPWTPRNLTPYY